MNVEWNFILMGLMSIMFFIRYQIKIHKDKKSKIGITIFFYIVLFLGLIGLTLGLYILSRTI